VDNIIKEKQCTKCKVVQGVNNFGKDHKRKDGLSYICKNCTKEHNKEMRERRKINGKCQNCGIIKEDKDRYYCNKCEEHRKDLCNQPEIKIRKQIQHKKYYNKNKETLLEKQKEYNNLPENKIRKKEQGKQYRLLNKEHLSQKKKEYSSNPENKIKSNNRLRERKSVDVQFKLTCGLRNRLLRAINSGYKSGSAVRDLGCSIVELKIWLENQFLPGMTWENWGRKNNNWQIDHIKPLFMFDLSDREQFLQACHYTNLRPLWKIDNLSRTYEEFKEA
jgi:hypothetical protein